MKVATCVSLKFVLWEFLSIQSLEAEIVYKLTTLEGKLGRKLTLLGISLYRHALLGIKVKHATFMEPGVNKENGDEPGVFQNIDCFDAFNTS